ncbi:Helicase-like transcription factor, partial [Taenia solium]|eukprot:TsM_001007200 transcript=TsM_001007200 gene=TsM_001007200
MSNFWTLILVVLLNSSILLFKKLECIDMAESILECPICLGEIRHPVMPPCQHAFCYSCISRYIKKAEPKCPVCRATFDEEGLRRCLQIEQMLS